MRAPTPTTAGAPGRASGEAAAQAPGTAPPASEQRAAAPPPAPRATPNTAAEDPEQQHGEAELIGPAHPWDLPASADAPPGGATYLQTPASVAARLVQCTDALIVVCPAHLHVAGELSMVHGITVATPDGPGFQLLREAMAAAPGDDAKVVLGVDLSGAQAQAMLETTRTLAQPATFYLAGLRGASHEACAAEFLTIAASWQWGSRVAQ